MSGLLCMRLTTRTATPMRLDVGFKVVFTVVVGYFFTSSNTFLGTNVDPVIGLIMFSFCIGFAGVVNVPSSVLASLAVDGELIGHNKQIPPTASVSFVGRDPFTGVLDNKLSPGYVFTCEQTESGTTASDADGRSVRVVHGCHYTMGGRFDSDNCA